MQKSSYSRGATPIINDPARLSGRLNRFQFGHGPRGKNDAEAFVAGRIVEDKPLRAGDSVSGTVDRRRRSLSPNRERDSELRRAGGEVPNDGLN